MKLDPAVLAFDAAGTPVSNRYGDIYHSADSGPGQARHVFLGGNDLPANWAHQHVFTIVETGFGLGINFLSTWEAWRADPAHSTHLHFVSVEKHPFSKDALKAAHERYPEFAALATQLHTAWPPLVPGLHRLHFENGCVTLTLVFADAQQALRNMRFRADAFYLDGFTPERNVEMWEPRLMRALVRLATHGATLATYTTAHSVRDALDQAGFTLAKRPGFGRKRDMLTARFEPRWRPRRIPPIAPRWREKHAIVIGAGLAGGAVCERLAARGWQVDLIDRNSAPAMETSGLHAAAFHPQISRDDGIPARLTRAGFLYAARCWQALKSTGHAVTWQRCGVLQIAKDAQDADRMAETAIEHGYPPEYVQYANQVVASQHTGCELPYGGWWFSQGGWIRPASLIAAQLSSTRINSHFGISVHALNRDRELWQALAADGSVIAQAPVVVLANAGDAARLGGLTQPMQSVRGQLTYLPANTLPAVRSVLTGACYVLPAIDDICVTGASYDFDDDDPTPRAADHAGNLAQLEKVLNVNVPHLNATELTGNVGWRCVAPDRMPLIGALPDAAAISTQIGAPIKLENLPRIPGLYGAFGYASRGSIWSSIGAELIANLLAGEPLPLEQDLVDAIDPGRFAFKRAKSITKP